MRPDSRSAADWVRRAKSDLGVARAPAGPEVLLESLCYPAQQAVEKAIKGVLIHLGVEPPRTHYIEQLIRLLPPGLPQPPELADSISLTDYAMQTKYPGRIDPVTEAEYREALRLAQAVVDWASEIIGA